MLKRVRAARCGATARDVDQDREALAHRVERRIYVDVEAVLGVGPVDQELNDGFGPYKESLASYLYARTWESPFLPSHKQYETRSDIGTSWGFHDERDGIWGKYLSGFLASSAMC